MGLQRRGHYVKAGPQGLVYILLEGKQQIRRGRRIRILVRVVISYQGRIQDFGKGGGGCPGNC